MKNLFKRKKLACVNKRAALTIEFYAKVKEIHESDFIMNRTWNWVLTQEFQKYGSEEDSDDECKLQQKLTF